MVIPACGEALPSVLVMSHSHPMETRGGAEIAALALFRGLRARGGRAWFLGGAGTRAEPRLGAPLTQTYGEDDYLYHPAADFDYFKFANPDPKFPQALGRLVARLAPDIVHAHHFSRFGVEAFSVIKRHAPQTKIVLSLHEFLAICNHHGQMVKTGSMHLCQRAGDTACSDCFPQYRPRDFFLRRRYIQAFLEEVDLFVAPSHFLAGRFRDWGLPPDKLVVLENMPLAQDAAAAAAPPGPALPHGVALARGPALPRMAGRPAAKGPAAAGPRRFGFFGQMSPLKGIAVLIEAAAHLQRMAVGGAAIEIHGDYTNQPPAFQEVVAKALAEAGQGVIYHGPYDNAEVSRLMRGMDAIIVPSIWWENSPVVIQEAFANGRPVLCSDIGGMAEKVTHGVDGLHFAVGQPESLARAIAALVADPALLAQLAAGVGRRRTPDEALDAHLRLYRSVTAPPVLAPPVFVPSVLAEIG